MDKVQEHLLMQIPELPQAPGLSAFFRELKRMWLEMASRVNGGLANVYYQAAEPTIADNTTAVWVDSDATPAIKFYLIARVDGTQKKVELT